MLGVHSNVLNRTEDEARFSLAPQGFDNAHDRTSIELEMAASRLEHTMSSVSSSSHSGDCASWGWGRGTASREVPAVFHHNLMQQGYPLALMFDDELACRRRGRCACAAGENLSLSLGYRLHGHNELLSDSSMTRTGGARGSAAAKEEALVMGSDEIRLGASRRWLGVCLRQRGQLEEGIAVSDEMLTHVFATGSFLRVCG
jgi:hypothetical protein